MEGKDTAEKPKQRAGKVLLCPWGSLPAALRRIAGTETKGLGILLKSTVTISAICPLSAIGSIAAVRHKENTDLVPLLAYRSMRQADACC
jgi:hypothetical protein